MWWAVIKCVKIILSCLGIALLFSSSAQAWSDSLSPPFVLSSAKAADPTPCAGFYNKISINGEGTISACVVGVSTRVASYFPAQGGVNYAVSFPGESSFYRLDVCGGFWGCVYSEDTDVLIAPANSGAVVYKNFVQNLHKTLENGVIHYIIGDEMPTSLVNHPGGYILTAQSFASSSNGKWLLIEIQRYGFFRIDSQSLEVRRIIAPGYEYGYGADPRVEMAISNDGKTMVLMGVRTGLRIVLIDETCGDRLEPTTQTRYVGAVTDCKFVNATTQQYVQNFLHALRPRFGQDGLTLSFDAYSTIVQPRHVTLFSKNNASEKYKYYVAIGDSFTSGEGESSDAFYVGGGVDKCHVSLRSYPYLVANVWGVDGYNAACSGATMNAVKGKDTKGHQKNQLLEIEARAPELLSVGIGGNDIGFMGKLKTCLGLSTCEWAETPENRQSTALEIKNLYPELKLFYQELKAKIPGRVIAVGYPKVISDATICVSDIGVVLNQTERRFMNESIHYLNQVISAAANDTETEYVQTEEVFNGTELCTLNISPSMNSLRAGDDFPVIEALPDLKVIGAESFHPTSAGHVRIKDAFLDAFPGTDIANGCVTRFGYKGAPSPGSYWDEPLVVPKLQRAASFIEKEVIKLGEMFEISLPTFSFKPLSEVNLELHSDIKQLGKAMTNEDGSLKVTISAFGFESGFHSLHVKGENFAGNSIDLYDFLTVEADPDVIAAGVTPTLTNFVHSLPAATIEKEASITNAPLLPEVLGAATSIPAQIPLTGLSGEKKAIQTNTSKQKEPDSFGSVALIIIATVVAIGATSYWYYRQKQSRNSNG